MSVLLIIFANCLILIRSDESDGIPERFFSKKKILILTKISRRQNIQNYQVGIELRPSQGFWETGETGHLYQGNKGQILRGTWEQGNKDNIGEQGT